MSVLCHLLVTPDHMVDEDCFSTIFSNNFFVGSSNK